MAKAKTKSKTKPKPAVIATTKAKKKTKKKTKKNATTKATKAKGTDIDRAFDTLAMQAGSKKSKGTSTDASLAALAMKGDVEQLVVLLEPFSEDGLNDAELYKWLEVASDFGPTAKHRKAADDLSRDLLESSMLRYDDDQGVTGGAHFDLGVMYLTGNDLPRDLERAANQLEMAKERNYPWTIMGAEKLLAKTRKTLDNDAREVFDRVYDGSR